MPEINKAHILLMLLQAWRLRFISCVNKYFVFLLIAHGLLVMFVSRQHNFSNILMLLISYFMNTKRVLIATPELGLNFFGVY